MQTINIKFKAPNFYYCNVVWDSGFIYLIEYYRKKNREAKMNILGCLENNNVQF